MRLTISPSARLLAAGALLGLLATSAPARGEVAGEPTAALPPTPTLGLTLALADDELTAAAKKLGVPPELAHRAKEAAKLYLVGRALRSTGITMTITGLVSLAAGIGLVIYGLDVEETHETRGLALEAVGGVLIGGGVIVGAIGVPLWVAGSSRIDRAKKLLPLPWAPAPSSAPTAAASSPAWPGSGGQGVMIHPFPRDIPAR